MDEHPNRPHSLEYASMARPTPPTVYDRFLRFMRYASLVGCSLFVMLLWIPPMASEANPPPRPRILTPALGIVCILGLIIGALWPGHLSRRILVGIAVAGSSIVMWSILPQYTR